MIDATTGHARHESLFSTCQRRAYAENERQDPAKRDRTAKLAAYKTLPSLMEYVLIGSEAQELIIYRRAS